MYECNDHLNCRRIPFILSNQCLVEEVGRHVIYSSLVIYNGNHSCLCIKGGKAIYKLDTSNRLNAHQVIVLSKLTPPLCAP